MLRQPFCETHEPGRAPCTSLVHVGAAGPSGALAPSTKSDACERPVGETSEAGWPGPQSDLASWIEGGGVSFVRLTERSQLLGPVKYELVVMELNPFLHAPSLGRQVVV